MGMTALGHGADEAAPRGRRANAAETLPFALAILRRRVKVEKDVRRLRGDRRQRKDDHLEPGRQGAARARPIVEHLREEGAFASKVTQGIRDFCRDARNMALTPRAELMLYLAREVQLADEVLRPALARADVVIADRYFYTAAVLAEGRDLPPAETAPLVARRRQRPLARPGLPHRRRPLGGARTAQGGQDPHRRSPAGLPQGAHRERPADQAAGGLSRAGRGGSRALDHRRQQRRRPGAGGRRHRRRRRRARATDRARGDGRGRARAWRRQPRPSCRRPVDGVRSALGAFLAWVDHRAIREPALAAYVLGGTAGDGIDQRRLALAQAAPRVVARGLRGLSDAASWHLRQLLLESAPGEVAAVARRSGAEVTEAWALRELLADVAPAEVAASLDGLDDETAWALRAELFARAPESVLASLALLDVPRAWELRRPLGRACGAASDAPLPTTRARAPSPAR